MSRSVAASAGLAMLGPTGLASGRHIRRSAYVPFADRGTFGAGVASGEPGPSGITLWTRLDDQERDRKLFLEISRHEDFRDLVYRRNVVARADRDHTVAVRVESDRILEPGERYWYRFETRATHSPVGRFQTARPPDSREPVRVAFWSCQAWDAGYYGAHAAMAREDVDLVVCMGDYIYEREFGFIGPEERRDTSGPRRDGDAQTLAEYRDKYRFYRSDPNLRAMHAAHPIVATWSDHEVVDNYAGEHEGDEPDERVPFAERRLNGYRSFFEYLPVRRFRGDWNRLYRSLRIGQTAEVFMLDLRQHRDRQPCGAQAAVPCPTAEDPGRTLLGPRQKEWFKRGLESSGAAWKLVGNEGLIMALDSVPGLTLDVDSWDGYGAERREVLGHVQSRDIRDLVFLTGEIHTFFAGEVGVDGRGPESVATEFVGGSITTTGIPEAITYQSRGAIPPDEARRLTAQIRTTNPHIKYHEQDSHGYGVLEAKQDELLVEFRAVDRMSSNPGPARTLQRFRVARGNPRVTLG